MYLAKWTLLASAFLVGAPAWADNVYMAGFEDSIGGDYDFNDLVVSLTGPGLTLHSGGTWSPEPVLGTGGQTFWDDASGDGTAFNVGYCIYGGGNCNGGTGLDPMDQYLAASAGRSVGDVYFSVTGGVSAPVYLHVAADTNLIGWYSVGTPSDIHWVNSTAGQTGAFSFTPSGDFGLVANNSGGVGGDTFYSQTSAGGMQDTVGAHFAFFGSPATVPEPGSVMLMGSVLLAVSLAFRRRVRRKQAG